MGSARSALPQARERRFLVIWQNPSSREFVHVGNLRVRGDESDSEYEFTYLPGLGGDPDFEPFLAFPEPDKAYTRKGQIFPFFANRVMSARRRDYDQYVRALGLSPDDAEPLEILARSGGERATDTIHVVPEPDVLGDGTEQRLFLVSGVRHCEGASERIAELHPGDHLTMRPDVDNDKNPRALLLDADDEEPIGWVPNYMLDYVYKAQAQGAAVDVLVERANGPEVPWHLRVLCRMIVRP